jgi:hypothetical protein
VISLALALLLTSPPRAAVPMRECVTSCQRMGNYSKCFFELRPVCGKREFECVDSREVDCVPLMVSLGSGVHSTNYRPVETYLDWPAMNSDIDRTYLPRLDQKNSDQ